MLKVDPLIRPTLEMTKICFYFGCFSYAAASITFKWRESFIEI